MNARWAHLQNLWCLILKMFLLCHCNIFIRFRFQLLPLYFHKWCSTLQYKPKLRATHIEQNRNRRKCFYNEHLFSSGLAFSEQIEFSVSIRLKDELSYFLRQRWTQCQGSSRIWFLFLLLSYIVPIHWKAKGNFTKSYSDPHNVPLVPGGFILNNK